LATLWERSPSRTSIWTTASSNRSVGSGDTSIDRQRRRLFLPQRFGAPRAPLRPWFARFERQRNLPYLFPTAMVSFAPIWLCVFCPTGGLHPRLGRENRRLS